MDEVEWLATIDPMPMLEFLKGKASDRKLRLLGVEYCRRAGPLLYHPLSREAIEVASQYAEGAADIQELREARHTVEGWDYTDGRYLQNAVANAICGDMPDVISAVGTIEKMLSWQYHADRRHHRERVGTVPTPRYSTLIRDILGNPFRPAALDPSWLTSTVVALSARIYESWDFAAMPILADALQDAGCDNADMLNHCRGDGPHVKGCWVVDLLLGKA